jgi:ATP-binding cassette, subfamily F, member 3
MHIIQLDRITISHASRLIFADLSWAIGDHDHVGLIGPNGAGKSSLLKTVLGELKPDVGSVTKMRGVRVSYLPQDVTLTPGRTLLEEAMTLPPALAKIEAELSRVEALLADPAVYNDAHRLNRALEQQDKALAEYERAGGAAHASRIRELLTHLGFSADDFTLEAENLSGGQKKLVLLARLIAEQPEALLLDEPDNHLDIEAKCRVESLLRDYPGAVILVSHDRYLLDGVATQIAELADGRLTIYQGNYTAYTVERELRRLRQQQLYVAQQKRISQIEEAIKRFEHWASIVVDERHIRQARSRRKMLDRMEANGEMIERVVERRTLSLEFEGSRGSTKALEIKRLAMGFENLLFDDLNLLVKHGERVGLLGPNGAGKSVLFKLILGEMEALDGEIKIGLSTRAGYYSQEHQTLDTWLNRTPLEFIRDLTPASEGDATAFLIKLLFAYPQTQQPIGTLSGGERSRLQLAALMLSRPNLLLLDEPTNNLDIPSVEALERALEDFNGAVLVISHDRYFLDQVVDRVVALEDGRLREYLGGYTDYAAAPGVR